MTPATIRLASQSAAKPIVVSRGKISRCQLVDLDRRSAPSRVRFDSVRWCAIELRDGGGFIGRCGLNYWSQFDEVEAGWTLRPDAWGHGYATEATEACIAWGFARLDLDYFSAMIDPANAASIGVAERLGFSPRREDVLLGRKVTVYALDRAR